MLKTPCCIGGPGFCPFGWVWFVDAGRSTVPYFLARALVCPCLCFGLSLLVLRIPLLVLRRFYLISLSGVGRSLGKDSKSKTHSDYGGRIFFSFFLHFFWCDPSFLINVRMVGRLSVVTCCCTHVFFGAREIFEMAPGIVLDFLFRF